MNSKNFEQLHSDWRNISINQLSITNNFNLTISTGFILYLNNDRTISTLKDNFDITNIYQKLSLIFCLIFLLLSLIYGIGTLFSRLYDFRITRNLIFARSRTNNKLPYNDYSEFTFYDRLFAVYKIFFKKIKLLSRADAKKGIHNIEFINKFTEIEKLNKILGTITWIWIKFQTVYLIFSFVFFIIYSFIK